MAKLFTRKSLQALRDSWQPVYEQLTLDGNYQMDGMVVTPIAKLPNQRIRAKVVESYEGCDFQKGDTIEEHVGHFTDATRC